MCVNEGYRTSDVRVGQLWADSTHLRAHRPSTRMRINFTVTQDAAVWRAFKRMRDNLAQ